MTPPVSNSPAPVFHNKNQSFNFRIGYEWFDNISKRWQIFYGLDFRPGYSYVKNDNQYANGGYYNGVETKSATYGVAPVLGLRCRINKRLSVLTESSLLFYAQKNTIRKYYTPADGTYPALPDSETKTKDIGFSFAYPIAVTLTMDL